MPVSGTGRGHGQCIADRPGDRLGTSTGDDPVYVAGKGIEFPSSDGFPIHLDYTAIWGILPEQAPDVVRQFGTLKDVEQKVILPQIESICRLHGSRRGAVDLLVGDTREQFPERDLRRAGAGPGGRRSCRSSSA